MPEPMQTSWSAARIGRWALGAAISLVLLIVASRMFGWSGRLVGMDRRDDSLVSIQAGEQLYASYCAVCHGTALEGQPNWKEATEDGRLPAPPHDATGHTWHHDDELLFRIVRDGSSAVVGGGYESDMIGFGDVLSDDEVRDILAFIKSRWPERERAYQAEMTAMSKGAE